MEKRLTSLRPITEHRGKTKFCAHCGDVVTQEALFEVDGGVTLIEKYCDICVKKLACRTCHRKEIDIVFSICKGGARSKIEYRNIYKYSIIPRSVT